MYPMEWNQILHTYFFAKICSMAQVQPFPLLTSRPQLHIYLSFGQYMGYPVAALHLLLSVVHPLWLDHYSHSSEFLQPQALHPCKTESSSGTSCWKICALMYTIFIRCFHSQSTNCDKRQNWHSEEKKPSHNRNIPLSNAKRTAKQKSDNEKNLRKLQVVIKMPKEAWKKLYWTKFSCPLWKRWHKALLSRKAIKSFPSIGVFWGWDWNMQHCQGSALKSWESQPTSATFHSYSKLQEWLMRST